MRATPLIGRQDQIERFEEALADAKTGRGSVLLVIGEAGGGKSAVLDHFAGIAQTAGAAVAWATVPDTEGAPPFWPWVEILRGLPDVSVQGQSALATALTAPAPTGESPEPARFRLFDQVAQALASTHAPLVILMDDMHRADGGTLRLLEFVAPTLRRAAVVLAVAARPPADDGDLAAVFGTLVRAGAARLELRPWSEQEVAAVLLQHGVEAPAATVHRLHAATDGNPFFVLELAREAAQSGGSVELTAPAAVVQVLRAEMRRLEPAALDLLHLAAVWGQDAPLDLLAAAAGLPRDTVEGLAAPAFLITEERSGALRFRHDLLREAVHGAIQPIERRRLHARLAAAVAAGNLPPAARTRHLAVHGCRAGSAWDPAAAFEHAVAAARASYAQLGIETASAFYALADDIRPLLPHDPARDLPFFLAYGEALTAAGNRERASHMLESAAGLARAAGDAESLARAALLLGLGVETAGHADQAAGELIDEAIARLPASAHALRSRLLARKLWQALVDSGLGLASGALARQALAEARSANDPGALAYALNAYLMTILHQFVPDHQDVAREITAQATRAKDVDLRFSGLLWEVHTAIMAGDIPAARDAARRYAALADEYPLPYHAWYRWIFQAALAFLDNRPDDARTAIAQLDPAATTQREFAALLLAAQQMELAARAADQPAFAEASARAVDGLAGIWVRPAVQSHVAAMRGDHAEAAHHLEVFMSTLGNGPLDNDWVAGLAEAALAACKLRAHEHARVLLTHLEPFADRWAVIGNAAVSRGPVAGMLAGLAELCGDAPRAAQFEQRARDAAAAAGTPGALFWMHACLQDVRPATAAGTAGLSPREAEVLALLAGGLSNQEIADRLVLSIRTVQRHVENIYAKTGARGRAAAGVYAASHGIVTERR